LDGNLDSESDLLDGLVDELVAARTEINEVRISAFSEGEEEEWDSEEEDGDYLM
jgi:hypothetical protein